MKYKQLKLKYFIKKNLKLKNILNNFTLLQFFEWNLPNTGNHWNLLGEQAKELKELGITSIWIPPPYKGGSSSDVGYGVYDTWDLGEFYQKGTMRTKYGTKEELQNAIKNCKRYNITVYSDIILNHKMWSDNSENFNIIEVNPQNRNEEISIVYNITAWTKYDFDGRNGKYSNLKWNSNHFTGVDYNQNNNRAGVYKIVGDNKGGWSRNVDNELGNFDYLMGCDIDFKQPEVIKDLNDWGVWIINTLNLDGFRLDALKHIDSKFIKNWLSHISLKINNPDFFTVGEYWTTNLSTLSNYIKSQNGIVRLFDVPLHYNLFEASNKRSSYDLTKIFDNTLTKSDPIHSVTFVDNHDTQPGQALSSWIEDWFKPHAYSLILLRESGYPCVFYGDLFGISGDNPIPPKNSITIKKLLFIRDHLAFGKQIDYFNHPNTVGWTRDGVEGVGGIAVILSNSKFGWKWMFVGRDKYDQVWIDLLGNYKREVVINRYGYGLFKVDGGTVSVYAQSSHSLNITL